MLMKRLSHTSSHLLKQSFINLLLRTSFSSDDTNGCLLNDCEISNEFQSVIAISTFSFDNLTISVLLIGSSIGVSNTSPTLSCNVGFIADKILRLTFVFKNPSVSYGGTSAWHTIVGELELYGIFCGFNLKPYKSPHIPFQEIPYEATFSASTNPP